MNNPLKLLGLAFLLWAGCKPDPRKAIAQMMGDRNGGLVASRQTEVARMQCAYLPVRWQAFEKQVPKTDGADETEMDFRLQVVLLPAGTPLPHGPAFSYGLDTLFALVLDGDTLPAIYAERMPQGNIRGIEYLVGFERRNWNGVQASLIFKDHLFTGQPQIFSFDLLQAAKIDSLSKRL